MTMKSPRLLIACLAGICLGPAVADDHHAMHRFPKDVDAFHAVLAPIWHAAPGKERLRNACAKTGQMKGLAKDIRSADASRLEAAVSTLEMKCQGEPAGVEGALFEVHEAFHHLIEPGSTRLTR